MERYLDIWTARKLGVSQLTRQAIEDWQLEKIKETLAMAVKSSPFYKKKYEGFSVNTWEDFRRLPFTCGEELCQYGGEMVCLPHSQISRIVTMETSGTAGKPKRIYFTEEDQELTVDFFHNGMQLLAEPSDTVMILMPCRRPGSIGDLLKRGLERFGVKAVPYGLPDGSDDDAILRIMEEQQVTCAVALASQLAALARKAASYRIPMKSVLLSAEYVSKENREQIEAAWNCKVFEHYGMTEMGLGCAVSCGFLEGCHIRESDLYLEIIDPETGQVLPDGQEGEVVFTTLTRKGMPFIRYRTGDWSSFIPEPCKCGSLLKRISRVGDRHIKKGAWKTDAGKE
ncbi:AMP-binding protein [bacterium 210820-DFI.6.37]|nr:AMP-binding protein [bacterium 210820-DFI.6.37]